MTDPLAPARASEKRAEAPKIEDFLAVTWRAIPSIHEVWPECPGRKTCVIVTDGKETVLLAKDLEPELAEHICRVHNAALSKARTGQSQKDTGV